MPKTTAPALRPGHTHVFKVTGLAVWTHYTKDAGETVGQVDYTDAEGNLLGSTPAYSMTWNGVTYKTTKALAQAMLDAR